MSDGSRSFNVEDKEFVMDCGHKIGWLVGKLEGRGYENRRGVSGIEEKQVKGRGG